MTVLLMDHKGYRASPDDVQYEVWNATTVIASGGLADRGDGLYTASFEITDYGGVHKWSSMPPCTKCHSLDDDIISPGPGAYGHERLDIGGGNNSQCLRCHNIYNLTAGRYHGHNATIESCAGFCHYNFAAMNDYGTPEMHVYGNESMGDECSGCHDTEYHPPKP